MNLTTMNANVAITDVAAIVMENESRDSSLICLGNLGRNMNIPLAVLELFLSPPALLTVSLLYFTPCSRSFHIASRPTRVLLTIVL